MQSRLKIILMIALIPLLFVSCKKKETVKTAESVDRAKVEQKQVKDIKPAEPARTEAKAEADVSPPKRNPFLSYAVVARSIESSRKARGPLECCDLAQFKILAIVVGPDSSNALIQTPDNKKYIVRAGDPLGSHDGKVVKIFDRHIVVREPVRDEFGKAVSTTDTEVKMPAEKGR